jgi:hypothetical protein
MPIMAFLPVSSVLAARVGRTVYREPLAPMRLPTAPAVAEEEAAAAPEARRVARAGSALPSAAHRAVMVARAVPEAPTGNPLLRPTTLHRSSEAQA